MNKNPDQLRIWSVPGEFGYYVVLPGGNKRKSTERDHYMHIGFQGVHFTANRGISYRIDSIDLAESVIAHIKNIVRTRGVPIIARL